MHALLLLALAVPQGTASYSELTDTHSEVVNFMPEPTTAMVSNAALDVFAVNPYSSTIVHYNVNALISAYNNSTPEPPTAIFNTGLNPVALALYTPASGNEQLLVVCAGTHAMLVHDAVTGQVLDLVRLESESAVGPTLPATLSEGADILVDADNDWAFVSCPSSNTVLKIDLLSTGTNAVLDTYQLPVGQRPGPMVLERGGTGGADNLLLVAMTVTGNNTIIFGSPLGTGIVQDLDLVSVGGNLPDEDVYLIDPNANTVTPYVQAAGSLLFDMERNPASANGGSDLWILSTDSINGDPTKNTEPKLRGQFAINQLMVVDDDLANPVFNTPLYRKDLDDTSGGAGNAYASASAINQARTMAVRTNGAAFIAGPFSDNIVVSFPDGTRYGPVWHTLPPGSECYDLHLIGNNQEFLLAYCLGTMSIELIERDQANITGIARGTLELGLDPTPDQVRRGRSVFLNGKHSMDGRFSCASCHPRAMTDQLGWPIADDPLDQKDVMLTQSLLSIEDTFPHHWRGERDLKDFQGAFRGLLGATGVDAPTDAEMDDLIVFFQSLQAPANPLESPRRVVDDSRRNLLAAATETGKAAEIAVSSAVQGQDAFINVPNFSLRTCEECHQMPTGGDGNMTPEVASLISRENNIEVPHLRQLQHRGQESIALLPGGGATVNVNGFGPTHSGGGTNNAGDPALANIFDFINNVVAFQITPNSPPGHGLTSQELVDVFRFVDQFDQGISPATHWATRMGPDLSSAENSARQGRIVNILINGFNNGWNDVVMYGEFRVSTTSAWTPFRNHMISTAQGPRFESQNAQVGNYTWGTVKKFVNGGLMRCVISGLPTGNSKRFGVDFDRDGLLNVNSDPQPWIMDFDTNGFPDGYVLPDSKNPTGTVTEDFKTARLAKYHVDFSEDVIYWVDYGIWDGTSFGTMLRHDSVRGTATPEIRDYVKNDTFVLTHDHPSGADTSGTVTYRALLTAEDRFGNQDLIADFTFVPDLGGDVGGLELLHVESVEEVAVPPGSGLPVGFEGFAFKAKIATDELLVAGQEGFQPADGLMVFAVVTVQVPNPPMEQPEFQKQDPTGADFSTNHATVWNFWPDDTVGSTPYTQITDYIVSSPTGSLPGDAAGETTFVFGMQNLPAGVDIKVSIMGMAQPDTVNPGHWLLGSLALNQPLRREGAAIGFKDRP